MAENSEQIQPLNDHTNEQENVCHLNPISDPQTNSPTESDINLTDEADSSESELNGTNFRYFKVLNEDGTSSGRYTGTPKIAASKAFTTRLQKMNEANPELDLDSLEYPFIITLRESTRGSDQKVYTYEAFRVKLEHPEEIPIGVTGKSIVISHKNIVKRINAEV